MEHLKTRLIAAAAAILLTGAAVYSVRFAWADILLTRNDLTSAARAVRLMPHDSRARYLKAAIFAAEGIPDEADLREAVALNPRNANAWMALGIEAEWRGDLSHAEEFLLRAAEADHTFKPAWTLSNFYARANQAERFWPSIRSTLDMAEPQNGEIATFDLHPIFDLCWSFANDANAIFARAIPHTPYVLGKYTAYLLDTKRYDAASQAIQPILAVATARDLPILSGFSELMLARDRPAAALQAWNAMADRHLIRLAHLDPESGESLTNGGFASAPLQFGFDWRFSRPGGIFDSYSANPPCVRLDFDGDEPEHAEVLVQWIPVLPGRRYRLETAYETTGFSEAESGVHWTASAGGNGAFPPRTAGANGFGHAAFDFTAPARATVDRLALRYDRALGTTRPKGTLQLYSVALRLLP